MAGKLLHKVANMTTEREASVIIAEKLKQIDTLFAECVQVAVESGVEFSVTTPFTDAWYTPRTSNGWDDDRYHEYADEYGEWMTSTLSCS